MEPLARPALERYRDGTLQFIPERRGEDYARWLEGIRDWCISRQLWWGHRIPVWYCEDEGCGRVSVSRTDLTACPGCGGAVRQDEDVLDTWFSSWLVPFSSLGWPEPTDDLATYYPGHTLVSAPEILFFWVARMIMSGLYVHGRGAVHHGCTCTARCGTRSTARCPSRSATGSTRSRWCARYGADALRYSLVTRACRSAPTSSSIPTTSRPRSARAGTSPTSCGTRAASSSPTWTARPARSRDSAANVVRRDELTLADRWIIARCDATVREATEATSDSG